MVTGSRTFGDEEYKIESQTSLLVPPRTIHAFGLRRGRVLKSVSILPDADAVLEHRLLEKGESFEMPEPKKMMCITGHQIHLGRLLNKVCTSSYRAA